MVDVWLGLKYVSGNTLNPQGPLKQYCSSFETGLNNVAATLDIYSSAANML